MKWEKADQLLFELSACTKERERQEKGRLRGFVILRLLLSHSGSNNFLGNILSFFIFLFIWIITTSRFRKKWGMHYLKKMTNVCWWWVWIMLERYSFLFSLSLSSSSFSFSFSLILIELNWIVLKLNINDIKMNIINETDNDIVQIEIRRDINNNTNNWILRGGILIN